MSTRAADPAIAFGDFVIDVADERLVGPEGPVKLGNKAYRVLLRLVEQEGRLLTKDALFASVWDGTIVSESALTSTIKELRRALRDESKTPRYIESVYGRGYRFLAPVREVNGERPAAADRSESEVRSRTPARTVSEGQPPMVLVSAFRDEAVRERHPYCAEMLREEVLSALARFREIQLIADSRPEAEAAVQRQGERGYQLGATLLPEGEGVKMAVRAKRLSDGRVVWGESFSLADTGTAGSVEKVVRRIIGAVLPAVDDDLFLGLPDEHDYIYDPYLLAKRRSSEARSFAEAKAAAEALEAIIAERPDFALAYVPLARLYNTDFCYTGFGSSGPAERARALMLAKQSLAADRGNVYCYTLLGFCHLWHEQRGLARSYFDKAVELNPYNPVRLTESATGLMFLGNVAEARALMERAGELNPIADDSFHEDMGRLALLEGDYEAAYTELESMVRHSISSELYRAVCLLRLNPTEGKRALFTWRDRIERNWHSASAPTGDEVAKWIARHHPVTAETAERLFAGVEAALRAPN